MSTTTAKNIATNSFGFASTKSSSLQMTCNICERLLYSFEEILVCRTCQGSYHWRCVKPETIFYYGENAHFICDKCNDNVPTAPSPSHRLSNGGIKIKSPDSSETDYRNFASIPTKINSIPTKDTTVVNAIRYFEEKQQQQASSTHKISKLNEFDGQISSQTNGKYTDDSKTIRRTQQQIGLESDEENLSAGMFQANYQYTPLKEYAAMKTSRTTNDHGYQNSPSPNSEQQLSSHSNGKMHYSNKSPPNENFSVHNHQQHFTSSTNLNVNDNSSYHQQKPNYRNSLNNSTPYLSQIPDQQIDRHSNVGSDSGIVMSNSNHENHMIEKKLTNLVQQLGRQLETDAQKLSEKLELKLKNLENMIHQQTYIIRRQDEVIERLKNKIFKIENERDHFRDRLSVHEQREQEEKKYLITETDETTNRKIYEQDDQQQTMNDVSTIRKLSTTSSVLTEQSRPSTKKTPAPRADHHGSLVNNENEPTVSKLIKTIPGNQERHVTDSSSPSLGKLISPVPLTEKPAAASRLDDIIHQSNTKNVTNSSSSYYNLTEIHHHHSKQIIDPFSIEQQQQIDQPIKHFDMKSKRSNSSSSTSTSSHVDKPNNAALPPRSSNLHRSLESIPRKTSQTERTLKATNKTTSLEFGKRPVGYDDPNSIYITPEEASHPASQYQDTVKGWLRKQNRDSFFKRIERYYCVLSNNMLLMHKHDHDTKPQKAINLRGAKVLYYEDQKHGPSLELTWSNRYNDPKHYHLYASNAQEAQQWVTAIQTAIQNLETRIPQTIESPENKWQRYRMQT